MQLVLERLSLMLRHTLLKFATVGMINTLLTLTIIFGLKSLLAVADPLANLTGYIVGLACSFALNKRWTFRHEAAALPALLRFLLVFGASYSLNITVVLACIGLGVNDYLAHMIGMPLYTIAFYVGCREFAFVARPDSVRLDVQDMLGLRWLHWCIASLVVTAAVLFYRLGSPPLEIWDEARLANNALEMAQNGWSLITTYDGNPDHWNTKPPLLVWMMALAIRLLGANEWAVRLPSALAAFFTAVLVFWFCAARTKRPFIGFAAVVALLSMPGYVIYHGARAGDYDAMMTLWITAYLFAGYLFVHDVPERRARWLSLCTLFVVLAFLTKTVQGLIFLPALCAYGVLQGRLKETLRMPAFHLNAAMALAVCVGYYVVREHVDPGYFAAVRANDLGGRYAAVIEGHRGGLLWYLGLYRLFPWLLPGLAAAAWIIWRDRGEQRTICRFLAGMSAFYLAVISTASTKLPWYAIPLGPLLVVPVAMLGAGVVEPLARRSRAAYGMAAVAGICLMAGAGVIARNVVLVERQVQVKSKDELDRYSIFLRSPPAHSGHPLDIIIVHPGYPNAQGDPFYVATTLFYANGLRAAGHKVAIHSVAESVPPGGASLALCGEQILKKVSSSERLKPISVQGECGIYERRSSLPGT